jgi:hypothetical protein
MADPNDPHNPGLLPPSPELVPIARAEYPNYYFPRHGRYFPRYRFPPDLQNAHDAIPLPSVVPIDREDMNVCTRDDHTPLTLIYTILLYLASYNAAQFGTSLPRISLFWSISRSSCFAERKAGCRHRKCECFIYLPSFLFFLRLR